ncbi:MAG: acyl-CoA thioesterase [Bacteroidota bacterium]
MKAKKIAESRTIMTEMIMPNDTNPLGNLMGGNLMRWMDVVGGVCAGKHAENHVVTASVDHVSFQNPIRLGDVITLTATVTRAFRTSLEVFVEVFAADITGHNNRKSNHAYLSFVAIDKDSRKPTPVPAVIPLSSEEEKLYESAERRRELRLILSGRIKPAEATQIIEYFNEQK